MRSAATVRRSLWSYSNDLLSARQCRAISSLIRALERGRPLRRRGVLKRKALGIELDPGAHALAVVASTRDEKTEAPKFEEMIV